MNSNSSSKRFGGKLEDSAKLFFVSFSLAGLSFEERVGDGGRGGVSVSIVMSQEVWWL